MMKKRKLDVKYIYEAIGPFPNLAARYLPIFGDDKKKSP